MSSVESILAETDAPTSHVHEVLDVRDLPPPEPLKQTLETLTDLDDRGFDYEAVERDDRVVTAIWRA